MTTKSKRDVKYIEDPKARHITYCKRKRGVLKKVIELSTLCGQDVCLAIFDNERHRMVDYRSNPSMTFETVQTLTSEPLASRFHMEHFTNDDLHILKTYSTKNK